MNLILRWSSARNQKYKMMSPSKSEPVSFDLCGDFWLMVGCFTSSCKYLIHIQNENKVNHIKKLSRKSERSGNDFWLPLEKYVEFRGGSRGGGGGLKKIAPSGGRRENVWGISCEKSRFYAKKSYNFPILGGRCPPPPPGSSPELYILF
jgi:hypothetical protein